MPGYRIKNINGKKQIVWNAGRIRGINEAKTRMEDITSHIKSLLKTKDKIKVLEIGCGYGRALVELKSLFEDKIETHGTNFETHWNKSLTKKYVTINKLVIKEKINKCLPKIHILDAGKKTKFKNNSFDFIFSQAAVQYIANKALFLE